MIRVGTSGFSYADWVGPYYPKNLAKGKWLEFYAREFSCLEINASFYSWIAQDAMRSMASRVPDGFRFAVKLHRSMTHDNIDLDSLIRATRDQNAPLESPVVLAQFPNAFRPSDSAWQKLEQLAALPNLVVEFRHAQWQASDVVQRVAELGVSTCVVDMPDIPGLPRSLQEAVGPIGYLRAHGKNAGKWYNHDEAYERYDYLYSGDQIRRIAESVSRLSERASETFVFFNNHYGAQAVTNARQLAAELGIATTPSQGDLFAE